MSLLCLLIADDLTGACDAAAPFASRGFRTEFRLDGLAAGEPEALAVSAESRGLPAEKLRDLWTTLAGRLADHAPGLAFKKIDSTLRGNVGPEIALALELLGREAVVITPAFPAMDRVVRAGELRAPGIRIGLREYWKAQGLSCPHVPVKELAAALDAGERFVSVDAASDAHLDAIVDTGLRSPRRLLWAGSAGLSTALARGLTAAEPAVLARGPGPGAGALFCIGSDHAVTVEQERRLVAAGASALSAETALTEEIAAALAPGGHAVLRIPYGRVEAGRLSGLLAGVRAPLFLCGGDTASLVCRALGVEGIRLQGEVEAGIPAGVIAGGPFDGCPVATKSGGFGRPGALLRIADYLSCATR